MHAHRIRTRNALVLTMAVAGFAVAAPIGSGLAASAPASPVVATEVAAVGPPAVPAKGALFGAAVSGRPDRAVTTSVLTLESQLGRKFDIHRLYNQWDDPQPNGITSWTAANGRTPVLSIKAERRNGSAVRWADIAAGREDAQIRSQARGLKALNVPLFLGLHHEPENDPGHGTPADYVGAWRQYVDVFRSEGVSNVSFTWILMAWSFERSAIANSFYPGDDVIDWVAADGYNWFGTAADQEWRPLAHALAAFNAWAAPHNKPMMVAEFATLEDPAVPGRKADWIRDAAAALETMPGIKAVLYFHAPVFFPWWVDSSESSTAAFAEMGRAPYFHTAPEAALAARPGRGPAPLPVVLDGAASYSAGAADLQWRLDFGDGSTPLITDAPPVDVSHSYAAGTYTVKLSVAGPSGTQDVTTSTVTALASPTAVTSGGTNVTPTSATLTGRVGPNGSETSAWFEYGATAAYGTRTPTVTAGSAAGNVPVSATLSGLRPNTAYHYRAAARNSTGTSFGGDRTLTTTGPATVMTGGASGLTATAATVGGNVDPNGLATTYRVQYGATTGYGTATTWRSAGSATWGSGVSVVLSGLSARRVYHYRIAATNSAGTSYGLDRTLTTR